MALLEQRAAFFERLDAFCAASGRTRRNVSDHLFGSRRRADELLAGADIGVLRLAQAERDLAALAKDAGITLPAGEREKAA